MRGLRRGQRARRPARRFGGQRGGALEEGGRRRESAARLGAAGRPLELGGDRLVGTRGRRGPDATPGDRDRVADR